MRCGSGIDALHFHSLKAVQEVALSTLGTAIREGDQRSTVRQEGKGGVAVPSVGKSQQCRGCTEQIGFLGEVDWVIIILMVMERNVFVIVVAALLTR